MECQGWMNGRVMRMWEWGLDILRTPVMMGEMSEKNGKVQRVVVIRHGVEEVVFPMDSELVFQIRIRLHRTHCHRRIPNMFASPLRRQPVRFLSRLACPQLLLIQLRSPRVVKLRSVRDFCV